MDRFDIHKALALTFKAIGEADRDKDYASRYRLVIQAMGFAAALDWVRCGPEGESPWFPHRGLYRDSEIRSGVLAHGSPQPALRQPHH